MDWFLYDSGPGHERVNEKRLQITHNFGYICRDILALGFSKVAALKRLVYRKASALKLNFDEFAVCLFFL